MLFHRCKPELIARRTGPMRDSEIAGVSIQSATVNWLYYCRKCGNFSISLGPGKFAGRLMACNLNGFNSLAEFAEQTDQQIADWLIHKLQDSIVYNEYSGHGPIISRHLP